MTDLQHIRLRIHEDPFTDRENTLHYQCACCTGIISRRKSISWATEQGRVTPT